MANKILKGLAIAAGTGVALGFSATLGSRRNAETPRAPLDDALEQRLQRQAKEIAALRAQMDENGRRAATEITALERRFAHARAELPAAIDSALTPRVEELRTRLRSEMQEATVNGLARIDRAIDEKLASRMDTLEKTVADQSGAIASLNQRALATDASLQKLISTLERLCDRAETPRPEANPEPAAEPSFLDLPFQNQYEAALQREPANPPRMFVPAFRESHNEEAQVAGNPKR